MDQAQFLQFMGMMEKVVKGKEGARRLGQRKEVLRIEKFAGQQDKFREWSGEFKVVVKGVNTMMAHWMVDSEGVTEKYKEGMIEQWRTSAANVGNEGKFESYGAELFEQLLLMTTGEAKEIVKGSEGGNGFVAWKRLLDRYDAKSQARFLRDLLGVIQPGL